MGTRARVVLYAQSEPEAAAAAGAAFDRISQLEAVMSDYREDSEAMQLVRKPVNEWHEVSEDLSRILSKSQIFWLVSEGRFDICLGPLTHYWRGVRAGRVTPDEYEIVALRQSSSSASYVLRYDPSRVMLSKPGMILDFGGIGKGYAAQEAADLLRELGYPECLVEIGGDLVVGDPPPGLDGWRVTIETGLRDVDRESRVLHNVGVATSGDAEQFIEIGGVRYSHIINPYTGMGVTERIAVTVIADDGARADAMASAISVMGVDEGGRFAEGRDFEVIIVSAED